MPTVVNMSGGGQPTPPSAGGEGPNRTLLIVGLSTAIVLGLGIAIYSVVPRTPASDAVTATDRERQQEEQMTPEQREQAQKAQEGGSESRRGEESTPEGAAPGR
jgi:hypothetical protein